MVENEDLSWNPSSVEYNSKESKLSLFSNHKVDMPWGAFKVEPFPQRVSFSLLALTSFPPFQVRVPRITFATPNMKPSGDVEMLERACQQERYVRDVQGMTNR